MTVKWRIWSNQYLAYWRPNSKGYTDDVRQAGLYSTRKARAILKFAGPEKRLELRSHDLPQHDSHRQ